MVRHLGFIVTDGCIRPMIACLIFQDAKRHLGQLASFGVGGNLARELAGDSSHKANGADSSGIFYEVSKI